MRRLWCWIVGHDFHKTWHRDSNVADWKPLMWCIRCDKEDWLR